MGQRTRRKLTEATRKELAAAGILTHQGGFAYSGGLMAAFTRFPVMMIWEESEQPTRKEVALLKRIFQSMAAKWHPDADKNFLAKGANTLTFKKEHGEWTFRRMSWRVGSIWCTQPGTLREIRARERL